jgi:glycosyltransferase involved in cell wall biosynthesis
MGSESVIDDWGIPTSRVPRVMMVVPKYPYPVAGGLERQSHELAKALLEEGIDVQVVSGAFAPSQQSEESVESVCVHRISWTESKWLRFLRTPIDLFAVLYARRKTYDVIHLHQTSWFGMFTIIAAKLLGKPILTKLANVGSLGIPGLLGLPFGSIMLKILLSSDAMVAMSEESIAEATSHGYPIERILVTPNGIRLSSQSRSVQRNGEYQKPCRVVFVGRLSPQKGLDMLLQAWLDVKEAVGPHVLLEIWGAGPLESELRRMSHDLNLEESVTFRGHLEGVPERLRSIDIFVMNSQAEGNSNAILEAMAAGLPVVSTRVGGTAMLVGPEGADFLFDPGDRAGLVERLVTLIRNPALREATSNAMQRRASEYFDIRRVARTYADAYRFLASGVRDRVSELSNPVVRTGCVGDNPAESALA